MDGRLDDEAWTGARGLVHGVSLLVGHDARPRAHGGPQVPRLRAVHGQHPAVPGRQRRGHPILQRQQLHRRHPVRAHLAGPVRGHGRRDIQDGRVAVQGADRPLAPHGRRRLLPPLS